MKILFSHIVPENISNIRLSDYAIGIFPAIISRKGLKKAIKSGAVLMDGAVAYTGNWVQSGQKIDLIELDKKTTKVYELALEVLFEDDYLAVVNKPGGLITSGNQFRTLENTLLFNLKPSNAVDAFLSPKPVHRLDAATSGLILIAKTKTARFHLGQQFENKSIRKRYQAIVIGQPTAKEGQIHEKIDNKIAITNFSLVRTVLSLKTGQLSLLNLFPITGRTHQLRIHLSNQGMPILGDPLYTKEAPLLKGKGLFLCAVEIDFNHPINGEALNFTIQPPAKFEYRLQQEARRWQKRQGI